MVKFYSVVFKNKCGKEDEVITVGTLPQVESWAACQANSQEYTLTYLITYLTTDM